jgi:hypothetical protein
VKRSSAQHPKDNVSPTPCVIFRLDFSLKDDEKRNQLVLDLAVYRLGYFTVHFLSGISFNSFTVAVTGLFLISFFSRQGLAM